MKKLIIFIFAVGGHLSCLAQPGALDLSFDPGIGASDDVRTTSIQADRKIIIGGAFTSFNGVPVNRLARLHPDGSLDTSFNVGSGTDKTIYTSAIQPDGKIIIGGEFNYYDSIFCNRIMRIHADGSTDTSFHTGAGFNNDVEAVVIQPDGKILVGGWFSTFDGIVNSHLVRLNADGTRDNTFNTGMGPNNTVEDIVIQPDGRIIIGGDFTTYDGIIHPALRIARVNMDGSYDASFNTIFGASSAIYAVELQDNGKVLMGGNFDTYYFQNRTRIAQLHSDGSLDSGFDTGLGASGEVRDIVILYPDNNGIPNSCLIVGDFESYNGNPINRVAVINPNGQKDIAFDPGTGVDGIVYQASRQDDGRIIISGFFSNYNGISRNCIARIYVCETMQPGMISGSDSTQCPAEIHTFSVPYNAGVDRYEWTLPTGWTGSSDSSSITVISNGQGGVVSVIAFSDTCGYSVPRQKTIHRIQPPEVPICLVTVDDSSTHNILIWEKPADKSLIDSFFIYRETTTGVYSKIASIHRDSLSEYHDHAANPNTTSYRYRLSVLDICGVESAPSLFHNTIHLQNLGNGNFQWTFYQIENSSNPVISFNVYRDAFSNGNFFQVGNVPGTNATFTDISYSSFPNSQYVIDVNWSISCTPARTVNTTRSNIRKINYIDTIPIVIGIGALLHESIVIYPNPIKNTIVLHISSSIEMMRLRLFNACGQVVWTEHPGTTGPGVKQIDTGTLPKGVYVIAVETNAGNMRRKLVVQ